MKPVYQRFRSKTLQVINISSNEITINIDNILWLIRRLFTLYNYIEPEDGNVTMTT